VILNVGVAGSVRFQDIQSKGVTGIKLETKGLSLSIWSVGSSEMQIPPLRWEWKAFWAAEWKRI
jgi:hypothetical protein